MNKKVIRTILCSLLFVVGIVIIALFIGDESPFYAICGTLLASFGGALTLSIWFPLGGSNLNKTKTETDEEKAARKEQRKLAKDLFIASMLIADEIKPKDKNKGKENVWEDNSEDNDYYDPDNW